MLQTAQIPDRSTQEASSFNLDLGPRIGHTTASIFRKGPFGEDEEEEESTAEFKLKSSSSGSTPSFNVDLGQIFALPQNHSEEQSDDDDMMSEEEDFTESH